MVIHTKLKLLFLFNKCFVVFTVYPYNYRFTNNSLALFDSTIQLSIENI